MNVISSFSDLVRIAVSKEKNDRDLVSVAWMKCCSATTQTFLWHYSSWMQPFRCVETEERRASSRLT